MDSVQKIQLLKNLPFFNQLNGHDLTVLASVLKEVSLISGEVFIDQDDTKNLDAYIIVEGGAKIYRVNEDGEIINLAILGPGQIVGEMTLLDQSPRSAYVETIQDSKLLVLSRDQLLKILKEHPNATVGLLKTLATRLRVTNERLEDLVSKNLKERTWKVLQTLSSYFSNNDINLSQEELSGIIGATRSRVTEVLNELESEDKIILSHKHIHVN